MTRRARRTIVPAALLVTLPGILSPPPALAANGTWLSTAPGASWSTPANWSAGVVASGADYTADFSTLNLTADLTVHLDTARTLGQIIIGDTTPSNNWTFDNNFNPANSLSIFVTSGTPTINVVNQTATFNLGLTSPQVVTKTGTGTLILGNVYDNSSLGMNAAQGPLSLAKSSSASVHAIGTNGLAISGSYVSLGGTGGDQIADSASVNLTAGEFDTAGLSETFNALSLAGHGFNANVGALDNSAAAASTLTVNSLSLTADSTVGVAQPAGSLTLNAPISGSFALTKVGKGTVTLAGSSANTFTGPLTVTDGTLNLNKPFQVAAFASNSLTIGDGVGAPNSASVVLLQGRQFLQRPNVTLYSDGLLNLQNSDDVLNNVTMTGGSITGAFYYIQADVTTLASSSAATISTTGSGLGLLGFAGTNHNFNVADGPAAIDLDVPAFVATGNNTLTKTGPGTLRLSNANSISSFTLAAGTLAVANDSALGTTTPVTITGGTLQSDTAPHSLTNPIILAGTLTVAASNLNLTLGGIVSGSGGLTKTGTGAVSLMGTSANTYTGLTTVADGTLNLNKSYGIAALAGDLTVGDGVGAPASATVVSLNQLQFGFDHFLTVTTYPDGLLDVQTSTENIGNIIMTGGTITNSLWFYHAADLTTLASSSPATLSGTRIALYGFSGQVHTYTVADGPAAYDLDVSAVLDGTSYNSFLVKAGPGTMRLSNSNTLPGLTLSAGTLAVANDNAVGPSGTLVLNGGAILADGSAHSLANPLTLQADSAVAGSNNLNFTGPVTLSGSHILAVSNSASTLITGPISGPASLTKSGSGTLTLSGNNTFTGPLTINAGSLAFSGGSTSANITNNANLTYNAGSLPGRLTNAGTLTLNADLTLGNGLENDSSLSLPSPRTLTLNGAGLDNQGSLTLAGGTLLLSTSSPNSNSGNLSLSPASPLHLNSATLLNAGTLDLASSLVAGPGTLTNTIGGIIRGQGTLSSLSFSNPGGTILVDAGTTHISPAFSSSGLINLTSPAASLTGGAISSSGTIQGAGNVANPVTNSGTIEPTGNAATLTLSSPLTSTGLLRVSSTNKLLLLAGLANNAGTISLTGGTLDNNNLPLSNTGSITGFGTLAASTLTNNSTITLTGGTTTVNGNVINNPTKTIDIRYNPAIFTSPVTNSGSITVTNTTATFAKGLTGTPPAAPAGLVNSASPDPVEGAGQISSPASITTSLAGSLTADPMAHVLTPYVRQSTVTSSGSILIHPISQGGDTSAITTLTLNPGSSFDLADTSLILSTSSTPLATLRSYLLNQLLFSSTANADPQHRLALGYADNALLGAPTWGGLPVDSTNTLVQLTLLGDANLDGVINADDYALLDRSLAVTRTNATWTDGDFNYDGQITSADYLAIDSTYLTLHPADATTLLAQRDAQFGPAYVSALLTNVPEPSLLSSILYPLSSLLLKRRRR